MDLLHDQEVDLRDSGVMNKTCGKTQRKLYANSILPYTETRLKTIKEF